MAKDNSEGDISALRSALEEDGFIVQEGVLSYFDIIGLYNKGLIQSCFGNNPATPYVAFWLPAGPGQTGRSLLKTPGGLAVDWHLRQDEAVVYIGNTYRSADSSGYRGDVSGQVLASRGV